MSTRCQIGFYEQNQQNLNNWEALIYRHSDGYPGREDGSQYGVLPEIVPFLRWWSQDRGLGDIEYCSARLLQYICNLYDGETREHANDMSPDMQRILGVNEEFTGTLGHGICTDFHGDIEFYYAIFPDRIEVYNVPFGREAEGNPDKWTLHRTVSLVDQPVL